eukprot:CAMPEP_0170494976 /NCGR_PEP_ID=MMETSP0208-20121228/14947_1 /TAXON_ID=197538 /ORGANISM="Strombidium inclinatum, Strain S3" /LENGTH=132 /DNA_ID=CAMNT_0010771105 /DNA_START=932 /DNA_END=1330 /DNA_ORIENTATION=+
MPAVTNKTLLGNQKDEEFKAMPMGASVLVRPMPNNELTQYKQPGGGGRPNATKADYVKKIIADAQKGPSFGQSRINFGTQSAFSGKSNTTMGGLASRFSIALSRVFDNTAATTEDEDEVQELMNMIDELNQH